MMPIVARAFSACRRAGRPTLSIRANFRSGGSRFTMEMVHMGSNLENFSLRRIEGYGATFRNRDGTADEGCALVSSPK
jgi:hypothetical protein